jgi:hypothetical protein
MISNKALFLMDNYGINCAKHGFAGKIYVTESRESLSKYIEQLEKIVYDRLAEGAPKKRGI